MDRLQDVDPLETREWVDSLDSVIEVEGPGAARTSSRAAGREGAPLGRVPARTARTRRTSTRSRRSLEEHRRETRDREAACARWCAGTRWRSCCAPGKKDLDLGGHIASFSSAATLYDVGFNHFWHAPTESTAAT
jgi:pyruvate dehydrogenase E1 component